MKHAIITVFILLSSLVFGQYTLVETGRPKPVLERNAQAIAGKDYKITYAYVAFNNTEEQLDSIAQVNKLTEDRLDKKKCKAGWRDDLNTMIFKETSNLAFIQEALTSLGVISEEEFVYFDKINKKGKYKAYVYGNIEPEKRKESAVHKIIVIWKESNSIRYKVK